MLAVLVVAIWGTNFVVIHYGLNQFPPFTFAALRFALASVPLLFFVPWPAASLMTIAGYGLLIGVGQFGLMLYALDGRISPGLGSVVIQSQAFFTVAIAAMVNGERLTLRQLTGLLLCAGGVMIIGTHHGGDSTVAGVVLVLGAAFAWACANVVTRRAGAISALGLVVWSSLFAVPPLVVAALVFEGPIRISESLGHATLGGWAALLWQSAANAIFGYGVWNWLLARYPASHVAPLGLLVPVFGLGAAALIVAEPMPAWKLVATAVIVSGLVLNTAASRRGAG